MVEEIWALESQALAAFPDESCLTCHTMSRFLMDMLRLDTRTITLPSERVSLPTLITLIPTSAVEAILTTAETLFLRIAVVGATPTGRAILAVAGAPLFCQLEGLSALVAVIGIVAILAIIAAGFAPAVFVVGRGDAGDALALGVEDEGGLA